MLKIASATVHQVGMELLVSGPVIILTKNVALILKEFPLIFVLFMEVYGFPKSQT